MNEKLGIPVNTNVFLGYVDPGTERYLEAPARLDRCCSQSPKPVYQFELTGDFLFADKRQAPRMVTEDLEVLVELNKETDCQMVDISLGGCAVVCPEEVSIGLVVPLKIRVRRVSWSGSCVVGC
jgi:hypothetical protein